MAYASSKPLEYRLMFGTPWPDPASHPELIQYASHAFDLLRQTLLKKLGKGAEAKKQAELQAIFIWSTLHGMATIEQSNVMQHLRLTKGVYKQTRAFSMKMIGAAMGSLAPPTHE